MGRGAGPTGVVAPLVFRDAAREATTERTCETMRDLTVAVRVGCGASSPPRRRRQRVAVAEQESQ